MGIGVNWLRLCEECHRRVFLTVMVPPVHVGALCILEKKFVGYTDGSTLIAVMPSPDVKVAIA